MRYSKLQFKVESHFLTLLRYKQLASHLAAAVAKGMSGLLLFATDCATLRLL